MSNKPYEKELAKYSPESVREGMNHPNMAEPAHETLEKVSKPDYPTISTKAV
jgi:hypothetical protein